MGGTKFYYLLIIKNNTKPMEGGVVLMQKTLRTLVVLVSVSCLILSLTIAGCSRHPNEKQCQAYEEQLKAATSAEELLQEKKQTLADAETNLAEKKQALQDAKSEKDKVTQRLGDK